MEYIILGLAIISGFTLFYFWMNREREPKTELPKVKSIDLVKLNSLKTKKDLVLFAEENNIDINVKDKKEDIKKHILSIYKEGSEHRMMRS